MKPAAFDYYAPRTLQEALALLEQYGEEAKILAGGQSLIPMMNMRLARPKILIDINGVEELNYIRSVDGEIQIGALTRHYMIEYSPFIKTLCPMLAEGIKFVGHSPIRSRGTIGGSLVHADPTAELPVILKTLDGSITLASVNGERTLSADDFFLTYMTTSIEPNEILISVHLPQLPPLTGHAIDEFALRHGDFAIVLAAAVVTLDEQGKIQNAILGLGGVDGAPVKLDEITQNLCGRYPDSELISKCCEKIGELVDPEGDIHASAEYRRDLSVTLGKRVLERAIQRALENNVHAGER